MSHFMELIVNYSLPCIPLPHKLMHAHMDTMQVKAMASYFIKRIDAVIASHGEDHWQRTLEIEFGGMNDVSVHENPLLPCCGTLALIAMLSNQAGRLMSSTLQRDASVPCNIGAHQFHQSIATEPQVMYRMYARTRDPDHLRMARLFDKKAFYEPMVSGQDVLAGHHANTHLAQAVGFAERAEVGGDAEAAAAVSNFFEMVSGPHAYATGGSNVKEFWFEPGHLGEAIVTVRSRGACQGDNLLLRYWPIRMLLLILIPTFPGSFSQLIDTHRSVIR